jgi:hypothetical protein
MRASSAGAAAAADPGLVFLHVALDDGRSFNSTQLGGAAWPDCPTGCRPPVGGLSDKFNAVNNPELLESAWFVSTLEPVM